MSFEVHVFQQDFQIPSVLSLYLIEMHADVCSICLFVLLICLSHWNSVYNFLVILKLTLSKRGRTNVNDLKVLILTLLLIDFTFDN